jgi:arsenical pump membrane protein
MWHMLLGGLIFVATLVAIIVRPYRLNEAVSAAAGASLMVVFGFVRVDEAIKLLAHEWNTFGFFLGLMTISAAAEEAGIFEALATMAARWGRGSALRLYVAVFAVGAVISVFLTNDATALILTPVVYALVTRLRLPVLPFMFACTFIADTASFVLPVSNPINVIVLSAFGSGLGTFLRYLLLPGLLAIGLNTLLFAWLYRRDLKLSYETNLPKARSSQPLLPVSSVVLGLIAISYVIASVLGIPLSLIALSGAVLMIVVSVGFRRFSAATFVKRVSWSVFVFIAGMFIVVRALEDLGLTAAFGRGLLKLAGNSSFASILLVAGGTAVGANLINNVPMSLVMVSALRDLPASTPGYLSFPFAVIFGADLGPNLTTVGSLATMLWLLILRRRGLEVSTREYLKLGVTFVPVLVIFGSLLIWARL